MPVVPPAEEDETVTSWLGRTSDFYGRPLADLLRRAGSPSRRVDLSAADVGASRTALAPIAMALGIDIGRVAASTIAADYPWATRLVARGATSPTAARSRTCATPPARTALRSSASRSACPGSAVLGSWRRGRSAPSTTSGWSRPSRAGVLHPVWCAFSRRHHGASRDGYGCAAVGDPPSLGLAARPAAADGTAAVLHRDMADLQDATLAEAARGQSQEFHPQARRAAVAEDLVWALTRVDRAYADRLVYEAFASDVLDSPWRMARRRRPGPVDFVALGLDERHILLATAAVLTGPPDLRRLFYRPIAGWDEDLAALGRRLRDADRAELRDRMRRWRDLA